MELTTLPSTPAAPTPAPAPELAKTEVGSYFVANYPPFSTWSAEHRHAIVDALDRPPAGTTATPLGLYLHIPFCRKRCRFCYFRVYTDKNADDIETYLTALSREIALYAGRDGLRGRQFEFVYFGGGTPSYLSNEQLKRLIARINEHWNWEAAREVTFECEPGTLKQSKLQTI
jgi:oxygen-independent coproporphyrinogen-3 oxidase